MAADTLIKLIFLKANAPGSPFLSKLRLVSVMNGELFKAEAYFCETVPFATLFT